MKRRILDAAIALPTTLVLAFILSASIHLDTPTPSATVADAQHAASAQARLDAARNALCGRAGWAEQPDGSTRCLGQSERQAITAQVQP